MVSEQRQHSAEGELPPMIRRGMRDAILCQSFGTIGGICFANGLVLLFLLAIGLDEARVLIYTSLFGILQGILLVPSAYLADRIGMKRCGSLGANIQIVGFALFLPTCFLIGKWYNEALITLAIVLFSIGATMFMAPWFPILKAIVPVSMRGHFFANLRISWQLVGLVFTSIAAVLIEKTGNFPGFPILWTIVVVMMAMRVFFYARIPGLNDIVSENEEGFWTLCMQLIRRDGYVSFSSYIFILGFFTASCPVLFAIIEKEFLKLESSTVVWLANATIAGNLVGYFLGGKAVDRAGTKSVFLVSHFSFAFLIVIFLFRGYLPGTLIPVMAFAHFLYGIVYAASNLAITTDTIALLPEKNQSLATAILRTTDIAGRGLSGIACAAVLKMGFLKGEWTLFGMPMSPSDAILFCCAGMIVLMVITLGLVPSVICPPRERSLQFPPR